MRYKLIYATVWLLSQLPLSLLYILSYIVAWVAHRVVGYRRNVVHQNLVSSFPKKSSKEIAKIERDFYHFLGDYIVETIKLTTMSNKEIKKRMTFDGLDNILRDMERENKLFCFVYLAHYGNWEWITSFALHIHEAAPDVVAGQIYHRLRNPDFDRLFLHIRGRFHGESIKMKETLRNIIIKKRNRQRAIIGFIADQAPGWNSIHHWLTFLNHQTPVLTGTEQIGRKVDALLYYGHVSRPRKGYYHCSFRRIADDVNTTPEYDITDTYFRLLEHTIKTQPALWLWSHKRWKRTYEEFLKRQETH